MAMPKAKPVIFFLFLNMAFFVKHYFFAFFQLFWKPKGVVPQGLIQVANLSCLSCGSCDLACKTSISDPILIKGLGNTGLSFTILLTTVVPIDCISYTVGIRISTPLKSRKTRLLEGRIWNPPYHSNTRLKSEAFKSH